MMIPSMAGAAAAASALLLCLLVLVPPPLVAGQQQQRQTMLSFSVNDTAWSPNSNRTLVSPKGDFAAGFVPSSSSGSRGSFRFAVWVAASNTSSSPDNVVIWYAHDTRSGNMSALDAGGSSALAFDVATGVLSWTDSGNTTIWSPLPLGNANNSSSALVLRLNDSGSLVLGPGVALWQSFSEPTDSLMAGQAIPQTNSGGGGGGNTSTTGTTTLQSANGRYRFTSGTTLQRGDLMYANMSAALVSVTEDGRLLLSGGNPSLLIASDMGASRRVRRLTLDDKGNLRLYSLVPRTRKWVVVWQLVQELCTIRGTCPEGRICVPVGADNVTCVCPPGYRNATLEDKCVPKKSISGRGDDDKFVRMDFISFSGNAPTSATDQGDFMTKLTPKNLAECEQLCRADAKCVAYGYKFDGDRTCLHYKDRLVDGWWSPGTEMSTFLRVAASDDDPNPYSGMRT